MRLKSSWLMSWLVFGYVVSSLTLSGIPKWSKVSALASAALLAVSIILVATKRLKIERWVIWPILFVVLCTVFTLTADAPAFDILSSVAVSWMGAICVSLTLRKHVQVQTVLAAMVIASLANAIAVSRGFDAYVRYSADFRYVYEAALRPSGLVGNPNLLAVQAIFPLFFLWRWRANLRGVVWRAVWLTAIACAAYAFFVSGSRKGLALMLVFIAMVIFSSAQTKKRSAMALGVLLVGIGLVLFTIPSQFISRLDSDVLAIQRVLLAIGGDDSSFDDRAAFLSMAWTLYLQSPVWGYGLDAFRHMNSAGLYSHNNVMELAVSGGTLLVVSYFMMFFKAVRYTVKGDNSRFQRREAYICLLALVVTELSMVTYDSRINVLLLMIILGNAFRSSVRPTAREAKSGHLPSSQNVIGRF